MVVRLLSNSPSKVFIDLYGHLKAAEQAIKTQNEVYYRLINFLWWTCKQTLAQLHTQKIQSNINIYWRPSDGCKSRSHPCFNSFFVCFMVLTPREYMWPFVVASGNIALVVSRTMKLHGLKPKQWVRRHYNDAWHSKVVCNTGDLWFLLMDQPTFYVSYLKGQHSVMLLYFWELIFPWEQCVY